MSEQRTKLFLDAQHLIYLAKSGGIHKGQDEKAATIFGKMALNSHIHSNFDFVITDAVYLETTIKAAAPDSKLIGSWIFENNIRIQPTSIGPRLLNKERVRDAGEHSIVAAIGELPLTQPYMIVADDKRNTTIWTEKNISAAQKIGTIELLNMVYDHGKGTLPSDHYAKITQGLKWFVQEVPNLDLILPIAASPQSSTNRPASLPKITVRS